MNGRPRALDNPLDWSFGIGRLFRIDLRVHVLFVLGALVLLYRSLGDGGGLRFGAIQLALLFLIVLIHEFGHCFGCRSVGGEAHEILMWPLGGLATVETPHRWQAALVTTLAGPAVNVVFCLLTAAVLIAATHSFTAVPWNPLHPFSPLAWDGYGFSLSSALSWLLIFFGLNYSILLFNLMPVFPLDGGRALQALLWRRLGYTKATLLASGIGMIGALVIGVGGLVLNAPMLLFIAVFGYMTCRQQRQQLQMLGEGEAGAFGYDFSRGYASLEEPQAAAPREAGLLERYRRRRAERRREDERRAAETRATRLDQMLAKVRDHGLAALTPAERRFLEEETRRRQTSDRP